MIKPMFATIANPNRAELRFPEIVLKQFGFLEERGFHCVRKDVTLVRYESRQVFVNIYHGRASYELNAEIGLLTTSPEEKERPFSMGEIIASMSPNSAPFTPAQVSTLEALERFVPQLASAVKSYAGPALEGDAAFFEVLSNFRQKSSDSYLAELKLKHIRKEADKAWRNKDYATVIELYEPIQGDLKSSELKKLGYARGHLHSA
jgi:hypothetical protein